MKKWLLAASAIIYLSIAIVVAVVVGNLFGKAIDSAALAVGNLFGKAIDSDGKTGSSCTDPIDERHRGLQWLDKGPLGQHLAIDFVATEGTVVRAITDGYVEDNYPSLGYYGGCDGTPGPVLITRHPGGTHGSFAVQYGHVRSHLKKSEKITAGQVLGTVINYIPCCDRSTGCPHLHFAIWDAPSKHPTSSMGYGEPRSFVDPDWFFENRLCPPQPSPRPIRE